MTGRATSGVAFGRPLLGIGYLLCQVAVLRSNLEKQRFEIDVISLGRAPVVQGRPAQIAPRLVFLPRHCAPVCSEPTENTLLKLPPFDSSWRILTAGAWCRPSLIQSGVVERKRILKLALA
jgi:hypothetical protein